MGLVLLVRHGQASFGADDYDVLSERGWEQGRALGEALAEEGMEPSLVIRGDMRRHRETAEALAGPLVEQRGTSVVETRADGGWDEFDHEAVVAAYSETLTDADLADRRGFQAVFERATAKWVAAEQGGEESFGAFRGRVDAAFDAACAEAGSGRTVLVVTSGGPIAVVCARLTGGDWARFNTQLVNTSVSRVVVGSTGARLLTFNEHRHLTPDLLTYR